MTIKLSDAIRNIRSQFGELCPSQENAKALLKFLAQHNHISDNQDGTIKWHEDYAIMFSKLTYETMLAQQPLHLSSQELMINPHFWVEPIVQNMPLPHWVDDDLSSPESQSSSSASSSPSPDVSTTGFACGLPGLGSSSGGTNGLI